MPLLGRSHPESEGRLSLDIDRFSRSHNFSSSFLACVGKTTEIRSLSLMHCNVLEVSPIVSPCPSSLQWSIVLLEIKGDRALG